MNWTAALQILEKKQSKTSLSPDRTENKGHFNSSKAIQMNSTRRELHLFLSEQCYEFWKYERVTVISN